MCAVRSFVPSPHRGLTLPPLFTWQCRARSAGQAQRHDQVPGQRGHGGAPPPRLRGARLLQLARAQAHQRRLQGEAPAGRLAATDGWIPGGGRAGVARRRGRQGAGGGRGGGGEGGRCSPSPTRAPATTSPSVYVFMFDSKHASVYITYR